MKKFLRPNIRLTVIQADNSYCIVATKNEHQVFFYGQSQFITNERQNSLLNGFEYPTDDFLRFLCDHDLVFNPTNENFRSLEKDSSRQFSYFIDRYGLERAERLQKQSTEACCAIVGLGGIGTHIAEHLCRIGTPRLLLVDHDNVEPSNLNRQILYTNNDIGFKKVDAAKYRLASISESIKIQAFETIDNFLLSPEFSDTTMLFVSADEHQFSLRKKIVRSCYPLGKPYMFVGYSGSTLRIGPFSQSRGSSCGACASLLSNLAEVTTDVPHKFQTAASGYANNAIGAALAVERWLGDLGSGITETNVLVLDLKDLTNRTVGCESISGCPVCDAER